jgi:hypothetical protein
MSNLLVCGLIAVSTAAADDALPFKITTKRTEWT